MPPSKNSQPRPSGAPTEKKPAAKITSTTKAGAGAGIGNAGNTGKPIQSNPNKRKDHSRQDVISKNSLGRPPPGPSTRETKRTKIHDIRSIASQQSHAALKDGELNVQSFISSLSFEMSALDESMRRTRTSQTSRAFQRVPFKMRRRAAAHNYKKVPKRLQRRARREMAEDNTPAVSSKTRKPKTTRARLRTETARKLEILIKRKRLQKLRSSGADEETISIRAARLKIRRNTLNSPIISTRKFRKRQISKTWLPTHLWHAKRARMTHPAQPLWRFAIPLTPTQKIYRPTHRIQWEKGAMAWDMSYMSTIGLYGPQNSVQNVLKSLGLTQEAMWSDRARRWRSGSMHWTGDLSKKGKDNLRFIGPATIIWNPEKEAGHANFTDQRGPFRQLYIRIHPSTFLEVFNEVSRLAKMQHPRPYVEDLRFELGSIDITGPDSTEALLGILKPYFMRPESKERDASMFESLAGLKDPGALPIGSLFAFSIADPRLHYPPRRAIIPNTTNPDAQVALLNAISALQKQDAVKPHKLFDRDLRFKASQLPSQRSLNRRRGKGVPGAILQPTLADPPIPILLLASRHSLGLQSSGTWTLILPWKCVLAVWYGLMHYPLSTGGNPWFGGVDEVRHLTFERGLPWFPGDFPGAEAGKSWELEERGVRQKAWERMPKGKRVNLDSLDLGAGRKGEIGIGWNCDYELLLGLGKGNKSDMTLIDGKNGGDESKASPMGHLESITQLSKSSFRAYNLSTTGLPHLASLVTANIKMMGRGVVSTCARIYRLPNANPIAVSTQAEVPATEPSLPSRSAGKLPPNLCDQWLAQRPTKASSSKKVRPKRDLDLETRQQLLAQQLIGPPALFPPPHPNSDNINGHPLCPDKEDLIGFVTTGSFNLRDGRGDAIGSLSATKALEELRRYKNSEDPAIRLCVVRNAGQNVGWLARWELI